jgi:hypothetical protein
MCVLNWMSPQKPSPENSANTPFGVKYRQQGDLSKGAENVR